MREYRKEEDLDTEVLEKQLRKAFHVPKGHFEDFKSPTIENEVFDKRLEAMIEDEKDGIKQAFLPNENGAMSSNNNSRRRTRVFNNGAII